MFLTSNTKKKLTTNKKLIIHEYWKAQIMSCHGIVVVIDAPLLKYMLSIVSLMQEGSKRLWHTKSPTSIVQELLRKDHIRQAIGDSIAQPVNGRHYPYWGFRKKASSRRLLRRAHPRLALASEWDRAWCRRYLLNFIVHLTQGISKIRVRCCFKAIHRSRK